MADQRAGVSDTIVDLLARLSQAVRSSMQHQVRHLNLTPAQVRTLLFVSEAASDSCTISALARNHGITLPTATGIIDALVHRKLLVRVPNPRDRRSTLLMLTADGEQIRREIAAWEVRIKRVVESLPGERQDILMHSLRDIVGSLRRPSEAVLARSCHVCAHYQAKVHPDRDAVHQCGLLNRPIRNDDAPRDCPYCVSA
ncbi:MAG: winged helix-turn-helix transcriptional regulator [Chloroflexi bacterium]|nr:winged helix-turn-helix transcriptional regulator [Chloroflexota bacterium]